MWLRAGLPFRVTALELQPPLSLRDYKRRLNRIEYLDSMHLLAPADEVVLTPEVAMNISTPCVNLNHLSCSATYDLYCVGAP